MVNELKQRLKQQALEEAIEQLQHQLLLTIDESEACQLAFKLKATQKTLAKLQHLQHPSA